MKEKILIIQRDADEQRFPLHKEKIVMGRDTACDVHWNEAEFSREHIAIHNKHDAIYIENVSTGGSMKINGKPTEYAELREGTEVVVGPYVIKWIFASLLEKMDSPREGDPVIQTNSGVKAFADVFSSDNNSNKNIEATTPSADPLLELPVLDSAQADSGDISMDTEMRVNMASDDTVTQIASSVGLLRVSAGEISGREIKLDHGKEWIVGRAKECQVSIDNPKLSRHHFRIIQIGAGFRIQDLDSSYGIKINGVGVQEAQLKSFDKISAGPVVLEFVIVDKNLKNLPRLEAPSALPTVIRDNLQAPNAQTLNNPHTANYIHNEKTNWPPAVNAAAPSHFQFSKPSQENSQSQGNFVSIEDLDRKPLPKERILIFIQNFKEQPASRKILVLLIPILILFAALSTLIPDESAKGPAITKVDEAPKEEVTEENPAESQQFSPEYQVKSTKEKAEIQDLYAKAEEAREKMEWQKAYDLAKEVISRAGKYKRSADIIAEAQGYLTDLQIATLSRNDADAESAAASNKQKVEDLLKQGEEALNEKRWDDAAEIYSKALLFDPKNDAATRGQYAATAKDSTALGKTLAIEKAAVEEKQAASSSAAPALPPPPPAPTESISMDRVSQDYQAAKQKIQEGAYREALPVLSELKLEIERMIGDDESSRNPAALIAEDKRNMRSKIVESLDLINDQFSLEYKTQMDDAQQAIANQKYVEARAIYDTIIKREPLFEEPRIEREKLYRKMMSDGQTAYREGLVSESVGDLSTATEYYEKAKSYFESISKKEAEEYYAILDKKLRILRK